MSTRNGATSTSFLARVDPVARGKIWASAGGRAGGPDEAAPTSSRGPAAGRAGAEKHHSPPEPDAKGGLTALCAVKRSIAADGSGALGRLTAHSAVNPPLVRWTGPSGGLSAPGTPPRSPASRDRPRSWLPGPPWVVDAWTARRVVGLPGPPVHATPPTAGSAPARTRRTARTRHRGGMDHPG